MSYETGTATGIEDLVDKLFTFATGLTTPWTQDALNLTTDQGTMHMNDCFVSFRWDATTRTDLALYQSTAYSATVPHLMTGDSGAGSTVSPATTERRVNFTSTGPFTAYHFFAADDAPFYIHAVVEVVPGRFRHFGFGLLVKNGNWRGGEYCYGHFCSQSASYIDLPSSPQHAAGLDHTAVIDMAAMRLNGNDFPNESASTVWAVFSTAAAGNDTAGNPRANVIGGARSGLWGYALGWIPTSVANAYKPLIPIDIIYIDQATTPDTWCWLGHQRDVAIVNMKNLTAGQEITVGADTWKVFPWVRKQYLLTNTEESWNAGWAYRKFT